MSPGQGDGNSEKSGALSGTKASCHLFQAAGNSLETSLGRVDVERQGHEGEYGDDAGFGAKELDANILKKLSQPVVSSGKAQNSNADHWVGNHYWQVNHGFNNLFAGKVGAGKQVGHGRAKNERDSGCRSGAEERKKD